MNSLTLVNELIAIAMFFFLVRGLKNAADPEERNRTAYLLAGLSFMILANILSNIIQDTNYTISQIGYTGNAVIITYTLVRYRLLDIQILMKKWMVYTGVTICITLAYLALLLGLSNLLRFLPPQLGIPATIVMVVSIRLSLQLGESSPGQGRRQALLREPLLAPQDAARLRQ